MEVTHENFESLVNDVKAGLKEFLIVTYYKTIPINAKCFERFESVGKTPIKRDGNGFRVYSGKSSVYILPGYLKAV